MPISHITTPMQAMGRKLMSEAVRWMSPALCAGCNADVGQTGLCERCWPRLTLITDNSCRQCGCRFEYRTPLDLCGECLREPPDVDATIAAAVYGGVMREMIIALKHGDRLDIAPVLANIMAPRIIPLLEDADFILPLPLHHKRFFKRRFNQSAELTRHVMAIGDLPKTRFTTSILIRHKPTPPQGHKSRNQRMIAMRGAFHVPEDQRDHIKDKHIVIIDDVMTTGASIGSAARCLKRYGAKKVSAAVAARVC